MKIVIGLVAFLFFGCSNPQAGDGTQGPEGPQGEQGSAGPQGPQGPAGPQGPQGPQGPTGATGATGPQGAQGPQGPAGTMGPQGIQGPAGATGATGPQGPQGIRGLTGAAGPAGPSIAVLDNNGNELGIPVPWRGGNGVQETAILMHQQNPAASFPEGWVMSEIPPGNIYYVGANCTGATLAKPPTTVSYGPVLYSNYLYWIPGWPTLFKKNGQISTTSASYRSTMNTCVNSATAQTTFDVMVDSGYSVPGGFENTKPWTAIVQ